MAQTFEDDIDLPMDKNGCYFIDRDPQQFEFALKYIRNDRLFFPKDIDEHLKDLYEFEIQHWGLSNGLVKSQSLCFNLKNKVDELLKSPPDIDPMSVRA